MKQKEDNLTTDLEDIIVWPDGGWCWRYEIYDMQQIRSDDYFVLHFGTEEYQKFHMENCE